MRVSATYQDAKTAARNLKSEQGENPEYDRALVELLVDTFHIGEFGMEDGRYIVMKELGMKDGDAGTTCSACNGEPYLVEREKGNAEIVEIHVPCPRCGESNIE